MKYIIAQPNSHGRVGHQFHNWILGLVVSKRFNIEFLHTPFSGKSAKWENVLRFNEKYQTKNNVKINKVVNLPDIDVGYKTNLNDDQLEGNLNVWKRIIENADDNTLFVIPYDKFVGCLSGDIHSVAGELRECYWGDKTKFKYDDEFYNVGVHIRRGDISKARNGARWLELSDYAKLLDTIREKDYGKPLKFHIFSEGNKSMFSELDGDDVNFLLDGSDITALLMMSSVDLLVSGFSTFPMMAAYLNDCPVIYYKLMNYNKWDNVDGYVSVEELYKEIAV
jgi:hypothetical protein